MYRESFITMEMLYNFELFIRKYFLFQKVCYCDEVEI